MQLDLRWIIVTNGNQKRLAQDTSKYLLEEDNYNFYPLDVPINVYKRLDSNPVGTAVIKELILKDNKTYITYELVSLQSVN